MIKCHSIFSFFPLQLFSIFAFVILSSGVQCSTAEIRHQFTPDEVLDRLQYRWGMDSTVLIFASNMAISLKPVSLAAGKYTLVSGRMAIALQAPCRNFLAFGRLNIIDQPVSKGINTYTINFEMPEPMTGSFKFEFINDYSSPTGDRNIYLYFPVLVKPY